MFITGKLEQVEFISHEDFRGVLKDAPPTDVPE